MTVSFAEFNQWGRMLAHCLNGNQTSAYLYTDGKIVQSVAVNDQSPPGFKKMSLERIISSSLAHFLFPDENRFFQRIPHDRWIKTNIETAISGHNLFDNDNPFDVFLQEIQALPGTGDSICQTLSAMCQKGQMKRTAQKTNELWGLFLYIWDQIKCFIWNQFYNPSSRLKTLQEYRVSMASAVSQALQKIPNVLKERVLINIEGFLEEIGGSGIINIENSKDINTRFLAKYHPDKYQYDPSLSEKTRLQADTYRQRIIVIKNIWEQFEKGIPSSPISTPAATKYLSMGGL